MNDTQASSVPPTVPRRSLPTRVLRVAAYVVLATFVVLVNVLAAGFLFLKTNKARELLLGFGMKQLQPIFPGGAKLGSSEGDLTQGLVLHDVVLNDLDGRPAVTVDRLDVKYSLLPLLFTRVQVDQLAVEGATVISRPLADGRDNLATMAVIKKPLPKPPTVLPVSVALAQLDADARFVRVPAGRELAHPPKDTDVRAKIHAALQLSHGMVASLDQLTIDVATPTVATIDVQGGVHITPDPKDLDLRRIAVRVNGDTKMLRRKVAKIEQLEKVQLGGPISLYATANGTMKDLAATLAVDAREPRLRVRADAHVFADRVALHELSVRSQFATVDAHGAYHFDKTGEGKLVVDAPDLHPFELFGAPPMAGSVKLEAQATRKESGHFTAHALGKIAGFRIGANHVGRAGVDVEMDNLSGHVIVQAADVMAATIALDVVKVNAVGDTHDLKVTVDARGPEGLALELAADASSTLDSKKLTAIDTTLEKFRLRAGGSPWTLDRPTHVTANLREQAFVLTPLGLSNDKQHLVVEGKLVEDTLHDVHLKISHFDLSQLPALISPGHVLPHTDFGVTAEASGPVSEPDAGAKFEGILDGRGEHDLIHMSANGSGRLAKGRLNAKAFATIGGQKVSAKIDAPMPLVPDAPINCSVDASVLLFPWFADILVPKVIQNQPIILYSLGAKVTAQGSLSGTTSNPKINASARVARWGTGNSHGDLAMSFEYDKRKFNTSGTLTFSELALGGGSAAGVVQLTAELPMDLSIPLSGESGPAFEDDAEWSAALNIKHVDIERLPFEGFAVVPFVRHGWVNATARLSGSEDHPKATLKFDARDMEIGGVAGVAAAGDYALDGNAMTADFKASVMGSEGIHIHGSVGEHPKNVAWRSAPLAVQIDAPSFDLGRAQLFKELWGTIDGHATITGSWDDPAVVAKASMPNLRSGQTAYKKLDLTANVSDARLSGSIDAIQTDGSSLLGHVAVPLNGGPLAGDVVAHSFKLELVSELLPTLRAMYAQLDGKVDIGGTTAMPQLHGTVKLSGGGLTLEQTAITYKDVSATLAFEGDSVGVHDFKMNAGTYGSMTGDARISLRDYRPETLVGKLYLKKYPLEWADTTGYADAALALDGKRDKTGGFETTVSIADARVELEDDRGVKGLIPVAHLDDVKVDKARPQPLTPEKVRLDGRHYTVAFKGPFAVHGRELDGQAIADLKIDLATQIPTAGGSLTFGQHGSVKLFGEQYELVRGRLLFGNSAQPNLDFRLARGVSKARIGVDVGGSTRQPVTTFWSEPATAYPPPQVASMVTGQHESKDGLVAKKGLDKKVSGPLSNLIAVSFRQWAPASDNVDVTKRQPVATAEKNKQ